MVGATARRRRARSAAIAGYVNIIARMFKAKRPVSFRERRGAPTRRARRSFWASFRRDSGFRDDTAVCAGAQSIPLWPSKWFRKWLG